MYLNSMSCIFNIGDVQRKIIIFFHMIYKHDRLKKNQLFLACNFNVI